MTNKQSLYSFVYSRSRMGTVKPETRGPFKEVFDNGKFEGNIERLVLEFTILKYTQEAGVRFVNSPAPQVPSFQYMPIIYAAFGKPKKFWRWQINTIIAVSSSNMGPGTFERIMLPEQYVDFVVAEAEKLSRTHGLQAEVIYHGDPFYARKYLQQEQQTQN